MPGNPLNFAGVNSRSESHRVRQLSPTRGAASRITKLRPCSLSADPIARPAWPPPITIVSKCPVDIRILRL